MSKTNKSEKFLKLVNKHQEKKKVEKFKGTLADYLKIIENSGAGEIILTSINNEGKRNGFDLDLYELCQNQTFLPIVANGGAENINSFIELFDNTNLASASAGATFVFYGSRKAVLINYPSSNEIMELMKKYEHN